MADTEVPFSVTLREASSADVAQQFTDVTRKAPQTLPTLTAEVRQRLLASLPVVADAAPPPVPFAVRATSLRPPLASEHVPVPFPPPAADAAGPPPAGAEHGAALRIVGCVPDGETAEVPHVSVTFSHPMVPLGSVADVARATVPLELSPQPEGRFRWLGDRTLVFEPAYRLPRATRYTLRVRRGTIPLAPGAAPLAEDFVREFETARLQVTETNILPTHRPILVLTFDQDVDPEKVAAKGAFLPQVTDSSGQFITHEDKGLKVKLTTASELEQLLSTQLAYAAAMYEYEVGYLRRVLKDSPSRCRVFLTTWEALPPDTLWLFRLAPGVPSLEGPLPTLEPIGIQFSSPVSFRVTQVNPQDPANAPPYSPISVYFTNAIDVEAFQDSYVSVTPAIEDQQIEVEGGQSWLTIRGKTRGRTKYTIQLDPAIRDLMGQALGPTEGQTVEFGSAQPALHAFAGDMAVLDPTLPPQGQPLPKQAAEGGLAYALGGVPAPRDYSVVVVNVPQVEVLLVRTDPDRFLAYRQASAVRGLQQSEFAATKAALQALGTVAAGPTTVATGCEPDIPTAVHVSLAPALEDGFGHVVVAVFPVGLATPEPEPGQRRISPNRGFSRHCSVTPHITWLQCTRLGLTMSRTATAGHALVTSLADGRPVPGAVVSFERESRRTDDTGVAPFPFGTARPDIERTRENIIVARAGKDSTFVTGYDSGPIDHNGTLWYTLDDRKLYKPGETAHVKGVVRHVGVNGGAPVLTLPSAGQTVSYQLMDPRGEELAKGETTLNEYGAFHFTVAFPDNANLGDANVLIRLPQHGQGVSHVHTLKVQEFRRPEFQVTCSAPPTPPVGAGSAVVTAQAAYFAGGPLAGVNVDWNVTWQATRFSPKGWEGFAFQEVSPPWLRWCAPPAAQSSAFFQGNTDCNGRHQLSLDFGPSLASVKQPATVSLEAKVMDLNYQSMAGSASLLLHPARYYVGVKCSHHFAPEDSPVPLQVVVCDVDGNAVADVPVRLVCRAQRKKPQRSNRRSADNFEEVEVWTQEHRSQAGPLDLVVTFTEGGRHTVLLSVTDPDGHANHCCLQIAIFGKKPQANLPIGGNLASQDVVLMADKESYRPGEVATIAVQSPFSSPAWGFAQVGCRDVLSSHPLTIEADGTATIQVPVVEAWTPNFSLYVALASCKESDGTREPAYASGTLQVLVSKEPKRLRVDVLPAASVLAPGGQTEVRVAVAADGGAAEGGVEVTLWVVDEAVLLLAGYELGDPLETFFQNNSYASQSADSRIHVMVRDWKNVQFSAPEPVNVFCAFGGGMRMMCCRAAPCAMAFDGAVGGSAPDAMIAVRSNFDALACFHASLRTDAAGTATATVTLPDSLTKYRVLALATTAALSRFGTGQSAIEAVLPITVRPSLPRFLNVGDQSEFTVVLQNQTDAAVDVAVVAVTANLELLGPSQDGFQVRIEPQQRSDVRFEVKTELPGTAVVQVGARVLTGPHAGLADAAKGTVPVWTPATAEAFAAYGEVDGDGACAVHALRPPRDAQPLFGGLQVSTASTILQALTDAFVYLVEYPFDCVEQTASKALALVTLRRVQAAFACPQLPQGERLEEAIAALLKRLRTAQRQDGFFGFWTSQSHPNPYVTLHAAHAAAVLAREGYPDAVGVLQPLLHLLQNLDANLPNDEYPKTIRIALRCKAAYVLSQLAALPLFGLDAAQLQSEAAALWGEAGGLAKLSLESAALLAAAVHAGPAPGPHAAVEEFRRGLLSRVVEGPGTAEFVTKVEDEGPAKLVLLHSDARVNAVCLEVLQVLEPSNPLIPKLVKGLLGGRKKGRWNNTQENVFALLAFDRYFRTAEAAEPDFTAQAWLGEALVAEHRFQGRETKTVVTDIPMAHLLSTAPAAAADAQPLVVHKRGAGRLYYRLGLRYAPLGHTLPSLDAGFLVQRTYEALKDPQDVQTTASGYVLRVGSMVRVRLTLQATSTRYHVALVDKLPACLEPLNPELAGTTRDARAEEPAGRGWWRWLRWYEHSNLRDERVEAFASHLSPGSYTYTYVAAVTATGDFTAPPATAEEMYSPEVFGRAASLRVQAR